MPRSGNVRSMVEADFDPISGTMAVGASLNVESRDKLAISQTFERALADCGHRGVFVAWDAQAGYAGPTMEPAKIIETEE